MKHALLSPSASHRWLVCPGSVEANANKPWEQNEWSLLGTSAHGLLEVCMRLGMEPWPFVGKVLQKGHNTVSDDMANAVCYALDWVASYVAQYPNAKVYIEKPVFMDTQLGLDPDLARLYGLDAICWGTPDVRIDNFPREQVVLDYKHGVGHVVDVKNNPQLGSYHLGGRAERRYQRYRSVIVQPRAPGRRRVHEHTVTDSQLVAWRDKEVIPVLPAALATGSKRVAGKHCTFCFANGNCEAQNALKRAAASHEFKTNDPTVAIPRPAFNPLTRKKA